MTRRANRNPSIRPLVRSFAFKPHEFGFLHWNKPGPSGTMGGYARMENLLRERADPDTLTVDLDAEEFGRLITYCTSYGPGGPNTRIRRACIPALRRIGIELAWG